MPTVVLGQDEIDCFASWVSMEAGLPEYADPTSDMKVSSIKDYQKFIFFDVKQLSLNV